MPWTLTLQLGLIAAGIALLARALPWPRRWLERKPLGCAVCLGGHGSWAALLLNGEWLGLRELALLYFGATAIAAVVVAYVFPPPFSLPEADLP